MSEDNRADPQEWVVTSQGSIVHDINQGIVTGSVTGDVHIGNIVSTRSALEELKDYLARAVADYRARINEAVVRQPAISRPYKFLDSFGIEDAPIFFGRGTAIETLFNQMVHHRWTVLHAKSGAGKTSLLQAGLSPRLLQRGWLPLYVRTSKDPVQAIKRAITSALVGPWPALLVDIPLHDFLGLVYNVLDRQTHELFIMLDQFEEFFRFSLHAEDRRSCIRELEDCYEDKTLPVRWLISLRKDYHSDLAEFKQTTSSFPVFDSDYLLSTMTREEAQAAIIEPVARLDTPVRYHADLLETLLADLARSDMELPLLQMLCTQLYEQRIHTQDSLALDTYNALGRAEGVLIHYLGEVLAAFPEKEKVLAKTILKALVRSDEMKQYVSDWELARRFGEQQEYLESVLTRLVDARLLHREEIEGERLYELAHEYLITEIGTWIDQADLEFKKAEELLKRELANWQAHHMRIPEDRLQVLYMYRERFKGLNANEWECLLCSALEADFAIAKWITADITIANWITTAGECGEEILFKVFREADVMIRRRAAMALRTLATPRIMEFISVALEDEDEKVKRHAVKALGGVGGPVVVQLLIAIASGRSVRMRQEAVEALGKIGDPTAVPSLITALKDRSIFVRQEAAEALGKIGDPAAVQPLSTALAIASKKEDERIQHRVIEALGEIGDPAAVPSLVALLTIFEPNSSKGFYYKENRSRILHWVTEALGRIGDPAAVQPLVALLKDEDQWLRRHVVEALSEIGGSATVQFLTASALEDESEFVRESASRSLEKIRSKTSES